MKVNSRLQQVPEYPEDADEPIITTRSSEDRADRLVHPRAARAVRRTN